MPYVMLYVMLSLAIALFGTNRKFGFWGYFFGSLLLTPFVGVILVLASEKKVRQFS
ncbi:MAG: hypothetical protein SWQ30_12220 [Thermodesulfobacteriota bacterium]|nr:hypothetical protein [Thermodesulfobacteriota bacterium]